MTQEPQLQEVSEVGSENRFGSLGPRCLRARGKAGGQHPGRGSSGMLSHVNMKELTLCPWVSAQTVM